MRLYLCDSFTVGIFFCCQIIKRDRKAYIINISKEHSIVSQFTSFVAIEEREKVSMKTTTGHKNWGQTVDDVRCFFCYFKGEKFDQHTGPSIEDLVGKEQVDKLEYMDWMVDQASDPKQVNYNQCMLYIQFMLFLL